MLSNIGNGTMNAPRCWQLGDDACTNVETSANAERPNLSYRPCLGVLIDLGHRVAVQVRQAI
jgi:hypothetical protein